MRVSTLGVKILISGPELFIGRVESFAISTIEITLDPTFWSKKFREYALSYLLSYNHHKGGYHFALSGR